MDADVFMVHAEVERRHWWFAARRRILRAVLQNYIAADGTHTLTEIGCGVGANALAFHPDYRWIGYDPAQAAIDCARITHPALPIRVGSATEAIDDLMRSDAVLLTDVIEHVEDDRGLLESIIVPMRVGAYLLVTVPAGMELWSPHDVALGHYRRYDTETLATVWEGLPVEPLFVSHFNWRLYPVVRSIRALTSLFRRSAGSGGTDFSMPSAPINAVLERVFAGEAARMVASARNGTSAYSRGVSILAVLRRIHRN